MTLGEKLLSHREFLEMTRTEVARMAGISPCTVKNYEQDAGEPYFMKLAALAEALNLSLSYLAGWSDEPKAFIRKQPGTMAQRLRESRIRKGITAYNLAELSGVCESMIHFVEEGEHGFSFFTGCCICQALDIAPEYLAGWEPL